MRLSPLPVAIAALAFAASTAAAVELLNVSYDPTRELYKAINAAFTSTHPDVTIQQSHGGSGTQARAVIDGLEADVVTLAMYPDTDAIAKAGLIAKGWSTRLPNDSLPYTSTIVFVVRTGNPKHIADWPDIVKPGVEIVTPNPKTSGNGKLAFLAAWGFVKKHGGSDADALDFVKTLYANTPVLDLGARGSTVTFVQKQIGDVHLAWENEAKLEVREARGTVEIVYPSMSILAQPHVAWVDKHVEHKGTAQTAREYLAFLYTPEGQEIIATHFYRPTDPVVLARHASDFPPIERVDVSTVAANWDDATSRYFGDGGVFDGFYRPR
jgi:sulfate/thiosulfate-binding protein